MSIPSLLSARWYCLPVLVGALIVTFFFLELMGTGITHAATVDYFDIEPTFFPYREMQPRANFLYESGPGTLIRDSLHVTNSGKGRDTVTIYPVDETTSQGSGGAFLIRHDPKRDVGAWITLSSYQVTLNGGQSQDVPFSVNIPPHVRPGQHFGGIVAEEPVQQQSPSPSSTVRLHMREVIGVLITIPGTTAEKLTTTGITYDTTSTYQRVLVELANTGTQLLHPLGSLRIINAAGQLFQNVQLKLDAILPQTSINYPVYMHHTALSPGIYTAALNLTYEHDHTLKYATSFVVPWPQLQHNFALPHLNSDFVIPNSSFINAPVPGQYIVGIDAILCVLSALFFWRLRQYQTSRNERRKYRSRKPNIR